jgi:uncharacterized protein YmfQ (DUF2313 family)
MALSADDYLAQLQALMPVGPAWPSEIEAVTTLQLQAWAQEFARIDARIDALLNEADPRTANELLADWERVAGLPDPCGDELGNTVALRQQILVSKLTTTGGQSKQYFIDLAAKLGFTITITEFKKHTVRSLVNEPINDVEWLFAWRVNAPETTVRRATVTSRVNEPLASWGNEILECNISRLKPAHTHVQFAYS